MKNTLVFVLVASVAVPALAQSQAKDPKFARDTWSPVMEVLKPTRTRVTDDQLVKLKTFPGADHNHQAQRPRPLVLS